MLEARGLIMEVMESNPSIMQVHGFQLTRISDGLCTYTDNRENYATTQVGLDVIIEEDGKTWSSKVPDEGQEEWLEELLMAMPDEYFDKYFKSKKHTK